MRPDRLARDDHAFNQLVRVHLHERTIFARAGFAFIGVGDDVFRLWIVFGNEKPLHAGGESSAAAPAQIRFLGLVDDLLRRHLLQRFFQRLVAFRLQVNVNFVGVGNSEAAADQRYFPGLPLVH